MGMERSWKASRETDTCWHPWHWILELSCPSNSAVTGGRMALAAAAASCRLPCKPINRLQKG